MTKRRRSDNRWLIGLLMAALCIGAFAIKLFDLEGSVNSQRTALKTQEQQIEKEQAQVKAERALVQREAREIGNVYLFAIQSCVRLNILRAEDNVSHLEDFIVFKAVLLFPLRGDFRTKVQIAVNKKSWTPLTDCRQAINRKGVRYRAPVPIPFHDRLPSSADLYPKANSPALLGG